MIYLDTSILVAYTITREKEKRKFEYVSTLIQKINEGKIEAITSFYTLIELFTIVVENAPDFKSGSCDAKDVIIEILNTKLIISKMISREERLINGYLFRHIQDSSDIPHAITAYIYGCEKIITYDAHFLSINHIIPIVKPEDLP